MNGFVGKVIAILVKDIISELRTKELFSAMFIFALLVVIIFNFAFELRVENVLAIAPGVLWVAFTFAGVLGLNRAFVLEKDKGCLEGLMLCPVDRSAVYLGKMLGNITFMFVVEAITLPFFSVFFNLPILMPRLLLVIFLGTVGFASVGTLFSAMAVNTRTREVMLPILLFPVVMPVIVAAVKSTGFILEDKPWSDFASWLNLLIAFDVIFLVVSFLVFEFVIEE
ncbi:MAG: heme exporter protein CcmB [Chloroflexi bacterium]|nr:heme exporter protein CcmB [Chloroflexota bacterium]MCL5075308.1 heme exporter protein CcmB [Chloroflexota bacterium]